MGLRALLNQRRYRRLSWALFAALMVHIVVVFTGNWGMLLYSTPSNQDRTLTLTLENTSYEGLKETSEKEEETVNDAKLGEAQETPSETAKEVNPEPPDVVPETVAKLTESLPLNEPKPLAREELKEERIVREEPSVEHESLVQEEPIAEQEPLVPEQPEVDDVVEDQELPIANREEPLQPSSSQEVNSDSSPDYITSEQPSLIKFAVQTPVDDQEPLNEAAPSTELDAKERKMLNKKVRRWASRSSKNLETSEPLTWEENGEKYVAKFEKLPAENDMDTDEVVIEIATNRDGRKLTTSLRLKKMAFSNFAQFVHQWDDNVSVHDDEMNGRFHSNTKINLVADRDGAPLFHGKVTTASFFVDIDGRVPRKKIFLAGLETGVKRIAMPKPSVLFNSIPSDESANSTLIDVNSRIIFNSDGSYLLQADKAVGVMQRYEIGDQPLYILAAPDVHLSVSGTVNGAVAVYSPKRIIIEGNLEYASTDDIDQGGDFLGLISGRSVVVANRKIVPEGDLDVQAAIYAKNRFEVKQLKGKSMGTLNVLGSVSAGTITATEPRYATNIIFDTRLENLRPPGFPVTDRYELLARKNSWQLEEDPFYEALEQLDYEIEAANDDEL